MPAKSYQRAKQAEGGHQTKQQHKSLQSIVISQKSLLVGWKRQSADPFLSAEAN